MVNPAREWFALVTFSVRKEKVQQSSILYGV